MAVAVFGVVLSSAFGRELDRRAGDLSPDVRQVVEVERDKLAGADVRDLRGREVIQESFIAGYRRVLWWAVALAVASAASAAALVERPRPKRVT